MLCLVFCLIAIGSSQAEPLSSPNNRDAQAVKDVMQVRNIAIAIADADPRQVENIAKLGRQLRVKFNLVAMAEAVLGSFWGSASPAERYDATELVSDILAQKVVTQFGKYQNVPFTNEEVLHLGNGDLVVVSNLAGANGHVINVDWRLRAGPDGLDFVDISIDGRSVMVEYHQNAINKIKNANGSVRDFIVSLRENLPTTPY
jgi:ABC-type transporter MlaC component